MVTQIIFQQDIMNKAGVARPVIFWLRIGERHMPGEVFILFLQVVEVVLVEHLTQGTCTVPEGDFALRLQALQLIEDV
ncbi:hypothetical protein D3C75_1263300 [compost metagenome]